ncbi:hypothetical protein Y032_0079g1286 [Ancylostoma ceylanicum]|uniref:Peptidase family M13 n=2 Tax=Ancylostoma ceylanicum TaxID=53326 RepID=A0A016TT67_9BILA|nr:hypothetical protein Y032_0079g1286 [Ancylostoma ceylanicum]
MSEGVDPKERRITASSVLLLIVLAALAVSITVLVKVIKLPDHKEDLTPHGPSVNRLNVPQPQKINSGHENALGYEDLAKYLKTSINTSVNPCEDFYLYTCGNFDYDSAFTMAAVESYEAKKAQINNKNYIERAPRSVKLLRHFYEKCIDARLDWTELNKDGRVVMDSINRLAAGEPGNEQSTQFPFYMLYQNEQDRGFPNKAGLAHLLGMPTASDFAPTLLTPMVDTNWKDPQGDRGFLLYIDQPNTILPYSYHKKLWKKMRVELISDVYDFTALLAQTQGIELDTQQLLKDAADIADFDHLLALSYSTDDDTRRQAERSFNPVTLKELYARFPNICWTRFTTKAMAASKRVQEAIHNDTNYNYIVMEPGKTFKLLSSLGDPSFVSARTLVNYVYFNLANVYTEFLPWDWYAGARAWVDKMYPTKESRQKVREEVANIASGILVGFRSMIDQLNWMSPASKQGAYAKIDNVVKNIAFPEWVTDDEKLEDYYKGLDIDMHNDDYLTMVKKMRMFKAVQRIEALLAGPVPRDDFSGSPASVNAWYQPNVNSITMPGGILRRPFYDPTWPNSVNYGAVGLIIGIRAAFRGYRNSIALHGPDPRLPDEQFQGFTHDQLFFLSFARVWCRKLGSTSSLLQRLLVDPHSPPLYRVFGTLQNFPAFKEAFNCPVSPYAPDKHCNVWVSELDTSHGEPKVKTELNIAAPPQITPNDKEKYDAAKVAISFFQESVNTSVDPCEDFYKYACGNYHKPVSFHFANARNFLAMANQLTSKEYQKVIKSSTALTKEKAFFDACVTATKDSSHNNQILVSKNYLMPRVRKLSQYLGAEFTYAFGGQVNSLPNKQQLANALGYLSFDQGIQTLVTPLVDTYWPDPSKGYTMFLDQNTAYMSKTFYHPDAFKTIKENYVNSATKVIETFTKTQNRPIVPNLKEKVRGLVEFEQMIANKYSTDDETRRIYLRSWNLRSTAELQNQFGFVDWQTYMKMVPKIAQNVVQSRDFKVSVMEPDQFAKLSRDYAGFDKEKLVNYLFMRLLLSNAQYLPSYASSLKDMPEEPFALGKRRRNIHFWESSTLADTQANCAQVVNELMMFANGRVFVDYVYPDDKQKEIIRSSAGGVMHNIIHAFQGMVDQLDWMSEATKRKAIEKSMNIITNIAFPDWILENKKLDLYYKSITFDPTKENYYDIWTKLIIFNIEAQYKHLTMDTADYKEFFMAPGIVNAWYHPELNTITFPAGILRPPYFHPDWPASIKYGGIGLIAGHELIHGFDDQGVQWGPKGTLSYPEKNCIGWMDEQSTKGFQRLAQCVIDEYNTFCPLDNRTYTPNCVNGANTQGENIADNGGIHAAFRAYRTHITLNGPDPQLPDRLFGQFTHDQLFFLSFAQVWCEKRRVDDKLYQQLMVDVHSPAMYRVFGTLQNYPDFRVAFNCPLNSRYAPKDHCNVWVPNYMP